MAFGSCRTSVGHDAGGNATHGVDALRSLALKMATDAHARWPDLVLFLGDQVYADETTEEMQEFIKERRDIDEPPGKELKDYEEYSHLYALAWSDPLNRWLLSTLPSLMIFDDHDVRDDWNTSYAWKQDIEQTSWWHERIVSGLASYWVLPAPREPLARRARGRRRLAARRPADDGDDDELDLTQRARRPGRARRPAPDDLPVELRPRLRRRPARGRRLPRRAGARARPALAARRRRARLARRQMRGDVKHLFVGTSLPFLLPTGPALPGGVERGGRQRRLGQRGPRRTARSCAAPWTSSTGARSSTPSTPWRRWPRRSRTAAGARRRETVTFLSGDVHHSYVSEVDRPHWAGSSRIIQAVCSPIRNPLPRKMRFATAVLAYAVAGPMGKLVARSAKVPDAPFRWQQHRRPVVRQQHRDPRGPRRRPRRPLAHRRRRAATTSTRGSTRSPTSSSSP